MSRIGNTPIEIPSNVEIAISDREVRVKGPLGELSRILPQGIKANLNGSVLTLQRDIDTKELKALHGLFRSLVANMVHGVSQGFSKELEIQGVGYRANLVKASQLELSLGFSHPVYVNSDSSVSFEVPSPTRIIVKGPNKEAVGQTAANIRKLRPPEPYKGKGIRYLGETIKKKAGKAAKS